MDWSSTSHHGTKRFLSTYEKRSLPISSDLYLVMPGSANTEVEELLELGIPVRNIIALERNQSIANLLHTHYWDSVDVKWEEVGFWLSRAQAHYAYIHLDYCSILSQTECFGIYQAIKALGQLGRLRVSLFNARRKNEHLEFEKDIYDACVAYFETALSFNGFTDYNQNPASVALLIMQLYNLFQITPFAAADRLLNPDNITPVIHSSAKTITSIAQFKYHENGSEGVGSRMQTAWIDLRVLPSMNIDQARSDLEHLASIINSPIVDFNVLHSANLF